LLSTLTTLTAAGVAAGGIALTSNDVSTAAEPGLTTHAAPAVPTPTVEDPKPLAARLRLDHAAAAHRAKLKRIAERKAAAAKAARERRAERQRVSRERERQRLISADPRSAARALLSSYGFGSDQFGCLDSLWQKESGWNPHASNSSSGAYGIPQALPGGKMSSAGSDWRTNPVTQIKWGLGYIRSTYGSPCAAWGHSRASGWY
jgi:hypothetical protein